VLDYDAERIEDLERVAAAERLFRDDERDWMQQRRHRPTRRSLSLARERTSHQWYELVHGGDCRAMRFVLDEPSLRACTLTNFESGSAIERAAGGRQ
jgi:hypothetical protein